jgi:hypothetical protein
MGSYIWGTAWEVSLIYNDMDAAEPSVRSPRQALLRRSKCAYRIKKNLYRLLLAKRLREKRIQIIRAVQSQETGVLQA